MPLSHCHGLTSRSQAEAGEIVTVGVRLLDCRALSCDFHGPRMTGSDRHSPPERGECFELFKTIANKVASVLFRRVPPIQPVRIPNALTERLQSPYRYTRSAMFGT